MITIDGYVVFYVYMSWTLSALAIIFAPDAGKRLAFAISALLSLAPYGRLLGWWQMRVYDLPVDFPSYQDLKVGDIFVWYMGDGKFDVDKNVLRIHGHWFQVVHKNTRYAEIDVRMLRCDNPCKANSCGGYQVGNSYELGWSKLQSWQHKTRWLRTPGAKVLFSERGK